MNRHLVAVSLAALMFVSPVAALAQTEGASTYTDTIPKKAGAHHATAHHASSHKGKGHRAHRHGGHKHHKKASKKSKSAAGSKSK
jgi:hypothetical protein